MNRRSFLQAIFAVCATPLVGKAAAENSGLWATRAHERWSEIKPIFIPATETVIYGVHYSHVGAQGKLYGVPYAILYRTGANVTPYNAKPLLDMAERKLKETVGDTQVIWIRGLQVMAYGMTRGIASRMI